MFQYFIMCQALVVMFTAFNAFYMVVRERKLHLGKYDWKLHLVTLSIPAVIGFAGVAVPFLGPSGPWYKPVLFLFYTTSFKDAFKCVE